MKKPARLISLCLLSLIAGFSLNAQNDVTVVLDAIKDTTIHSEGEISNAQGNYLFVGQTAKEEQRRALLAFDLSEIPSDAAILDVSLTLFMNKSVVGGAEVAMHRLLQDWGEGPSKASGQEGTGTDAGVGDATWTQRFSPDQGWEMPGGDVIATPSAVATVGGTGFDSWTGDGLISDVQSWIDNREANFGWILVGPTGITSTKRFYSRNSGEAERQPKLSITYTAGPPPELWAGYPIEPDGISVNTEGWLGWIDISTAPWIYSYSIGNFMYLPEEDVSDGGAWSYVIK